MKGMVFTELVEFVEEKFGFELTDGEGNAFYFISLPIIQPQLILQENTDA